MALPNLAPLEVPGDAFGSSATDCPFDNGKVTLVDRECLRKDSNRVGVWTSSSARHKAVAWPAESTDLCFGRDEDFEALLF